MKTKSIWNPRRQAPKLAALLAATAALALVSIRLLHSQENNGNPELTALIQEFEQQQSAMESDLAALKQQARTGNQSAEQLAAAINSWKQANDARLRRVKELMDALEALQPSTDQGLVGFGNSAGGSSYAVGFNNQVEGANATALGEGLVVHGNNAVAVGAFNASTGDSASAVFAVGTGDANQRRNALEVHPNGDILIDKPQGDIPMYQP